jgi:hypothetical protein
MLQVWNNFIGGTQAWIEYAYEEMMQPVLMANGYNDRYVQIRLKRPSIDRAGVKTEQVKTAISGKAILPSEIRSNLPDLDLPEMTDEIKAELETEYAGAGFGNPFAAEGFKNIKNPVEKTDAMQDNEDGLTRAVRACKSAVLEEVRKSYPARR